MQQREHLQHKLKNRHVQMIALGGAIGTGFFLGSSKAIEMTGPSIALAYLFGGLIIYVIMRALGEMTVDYPTAGSYVEYSHRYLGNGVGFISGWNSWLLFTLICVLELDSISHLLDYWIHIPHWVTSFTLLMIFSGVNFMGIRWFGETQFWFVAIKIATIAFMILGGIWLIFSEHSVNQTARLNLHNYSHHISILFSHGISGFFKALIIVCLSFCGVEFASIASGEAENPTKLIPKAVNGVITRIIFFYVSGIAIVVLISSEADIASDSNPFSHIFNNMGVSRPTEVLNLIAIFAMFSALNSFMYGASRILYRLALNQQITHSFTKVDQHDLPKNAIMFTTLIIFLIVVANSLSHHKLYPYLYTITIAAIIINWYVILITHLFFRRNKIIHHRQLHYKLPFAPYINIFIMIALFFILCTLSTDKDMQTSIYTVPAWVIFLWILYILQKKFKTTPK